MKIKYIILTLLIAIFLTACGSEEATTPTPEPIAAEPEPTDAPPTETAVPPTHTPEPTNTPEPTATAVPPTNTPMPTATPKPRLGNAWQRPADDMLMLYIPSDTFTMDSKEEAHDVTLDAFWMDQTEVTNAQFAQFVEDTSYVTTAETEGNAGVLDGEDREVEGADWQHPQGPTSDLTGLEQHPVVQVSWEDASAYCQWADAELPTEAQWEYASRGVAGSFYPWSNFFHEKGGNFCDVNCLTSEGDMAVDDGYTLTAPVGTYPGDVSWAGVLDLGGNVSELVFDWYTNDYHETSSSNNPTGPESGEARVMRGGNFILGQTRMSGLSRLNQFPTSRYDIYGFRCVSNNLDKIVDPTIEPYTPPIRDTDALLEEEYMGDWTTITDFDGQCTGIVLDTADVLLNGITLEADHTFPSEFGSYAGNWGVFNQVLFLDTPSFEEEMVPFTRTTPSYGSGDEFVYKIGDACIRLIRY